MKMPTVSPTGTPAALLVAAYERQVDAFHAVLVAMRAMPPRPCDYATVEALDTARCEYATRVSIAERLRGDAAMLRDSCVSQVRALAAANARADARLQAIPNAMRLG